MDDGAGIRERFLAAVRAAQREAVLLALGATALSLAAAAIFGWLCYVVFTFAGAVLSLHAVPGVPRHARRVRRDIPR